QGEGSIVVDDGSLGALVFRRVEIRFESGRGMRQRHKAEAEPGGDGKMRSDLVLVLDVGRNAGGVDVGFGSVADLSKSGRVAQQEIGESVSGGGAGKRPLAVGSSGGNLPLGIEHLREPGGDVMFAPQP